VLELNGEAVVAGAIVGAEEGDVGRSGGQGESGNKFVAAILMDALLMFIGEAEAPLFGQAVSEVVFVGGAGLQCVRRVVVGIDERALASVCAAGEARGICWIVGDAGRDGLIDSGEGVNPTVLREVVVIETDACTKNGVLRSAGSISEAEARRDGFAVVVGNAADERNIERVESLEGGILRLVAARGDEQAESGVVTQASVNREGWRDAPTVFGVEAQTAERLREGAVAGGSVGTSGIWKSGGGAIVVGGELGRIVEIKGWILGELDEVLGGGGKRTAKNWFMDEIHAKAKLMPASSVGDVVTELIFLLIARDGERRDDGGELIVAERFKTGGGVKICAERKREREVEI